MPPKTPPSSLIVPGLNPLYTVYRGIRRYLKLEVVKFKLLFFLLPLSLNCSIQHFTRNIQTLDRQNEYKSEIYKTVE